MNSRQRVDAAMRHETPDRVPVMCQIALGHYFLNCETPPSEIWFDSEVFAATLTEFCRRYRFDGILLNLPGRPADWRNRIALFECDAAGSRIAWRDGLLTTLPDDDNPQTTTGDGQPLARAEVDTVEPGAPATFRTPGLVWNTWHAPTLWDIPPDADLARTSSYPDWFTLGLRAARLNNPEISVHMEVFSPLTHLMELFGYENGLIALIDAADKCHSLLRRFAGITSAMVTCYAACEPDAILISSAFAGAGFISRDMYREFVVPYEKTVVDAIRGHGLPSYVHTCGAIGDRLDLMAETGVDGIDTLDPPPLGTVDLARAKSDFGDRFFFKGNLDAVNEMLRADDATFDEAVRRRIEIAKPGSGYILSSACSVAPGVRPERLLRMVELAEECGQY